MIVNTGVVGQLYDTPTPIVFTACITSLYLILCTMQGHESFVHDKLRNILEMRLNVAIRNSRLHETQQIIYNTVNQHKL